MTRLNQCVDFDSECDISHVCDDAVTSGVALTFLLSAQPSLFLSLFTSKSAVVLFLLQQVLVLDDDADLPWNFKSTLAVAIGTGTTYRSRKNHVFGTITSCIGYIQSN